MSKSIDPIRSRVSLSTRVRPARYWFSMSSPTARTRRLDKLSISSIALRPSRNSSKTLTIPRMSSLRKVLKESGVSSPKRAFILTRPTVERSYFSGSKNKPQNSDSAASTVGGSPGRKIRKISNKASSRVLFLSARRVSRK